MTYSIVARDPETGELGVGIQTHQPAAGASCPWVQAGVGAVVTQATGNVAFGPQALALLANGLPADRTLAAILAADNLPEKRQVAIVDAEGRVAVHTGEACIPFAGHRTGDGYSVQANLVARDTVPDAMAEAFELTKGPLPVRILAALDAAEAEGGDLRGRQSAALLVMREPLDYRWDLRVDNDPEPLVKLRELVSIRLASQVLKSIDLDRAGDDPGRRLAAAVSAFARAQELAPSDEDAFFFAVRTLTAVPAIDEACRILDALFERAPQWRDLLLRLPEEELKPLQERYR